MERPADHRRRGRGDRNGAELFGRRTPTSLATDLAITDAMPLAKVEDRVSEVVETVERAERRVTATKHGQGAVVLIPVDSESLEASIEVCTDRPVLAAIAETNAEHGAGDGRGARQGRGAPALGGSDFRITYYNRCDTLAACAAFGLIRISTRRYGGRPRSSANQCLNSFGRPRRSGPKRRSPCVRASDSLTSPGRSTAAAVGLDGAGTPWLNRWRRTEKVGDAHRRRSAHRDH